jgi:hypothetical protein
MIKGDFQNVTSATPFAGGDRRPPGRRSEDRDGREHRHERCPAAACTAQEVPEPSWGSSAEAQMRLKNCQQFITDHSARPHRSARTGLMAFRSISPLCRFRESSWSSWSRCPSRRCARRSAPSRSQFGQLMIGFAPIAAATGAPLDVKQIIHWFAKRWDIEYPEQFFAASAAALGAQAALPGQGSGSGAPTPGAPGATPPGGPNLGVTSDTAVDASKPSATGGLSMSPAMFLQRAQALAGSPQGG